jgi:hypothetical protein
LFEELFLAVAPKPPESLDGNLLKQFCARAFKKKLGSLDRKPHVKRLFRIAERDNPPVATQIPPSVATSKSPTPERT